MSCSFLMNEWGKFDDTRQLNGSLRIEQRYIKMRMQLKIEI